jgi:hypothetical protein
VAGVGPTSRPPGAARASLRSSAPGGRAAARHRTLGRPPGVHHPPWAATAGAATGKRPGHLLRERSRSSPFGSRGAARTCRRRSGRARLNDRCSRTPDQPPVGQTRTHALRPRLRNQPNTALRPCASATGRRLATSSARVASQFEIRCRFHAKGALWARVLQSRESDSAGGLPRRLEANDRGSTYNPVHRAFPERVVLVPVPTLLAEGAGRH